MSEAIRAPGSAAARARSRKRPTTGPRASRAAPQDNGIIDQRGRARRSTGSTKQILVAKPRKDVDIAVIVRAGLVARTFRALWGAQQLEAGPGKGVRKEESAVG